MIDSYITKKVEELVSQVDNINALIADLHHNGVESRISYKESTKGEPPRIDLWRVVEHIDYLKKDTQSE